MEAGLPRVPLVKRGSGCCWRTKAHGRPNTNGGFHQVASVPGLEKEPSRDETHKDSIIFPRSYEEGLRAQMEPETHPKDG